MSSPTSPPFPQCTAAPPAAVEMRYLQGLPSFQEQLGGPLFSSSSSRRGCKIKGGQGEKQGAADSYFTREARATEQPSASGLFLLLPLPYCKNGISCSVSLSLPKHLSQFLGRRGELCLPSAAAVIDCFSPGSREMRKTKKQRCGERLEML